MKKLQGLGNPALIAAVANTPQGKRVISDTLETASKTAKSSYLFLKYAVGAGVVGVVGYYGYTKLFNGFTRISEDSRFTPANITSGVATAKANAIYDVLYGVGSNFAKIQTILINVNHNGLIRIYNQFGKRKGFSLSFFPKKLNLFEWFFDQLEQNELVQLKQKYPYLF